MNTFVIVGGTGSFGSALVRYLLEYTDHKVRILSRDEDKQERMMQVFPSDAKTTYILADVRDRERLITAFYRADIIVHAAALKRVPLGELHAQEFFKTNVLGTYNVIEAAIANSATVSKVLFISSDKACNPSNGYGKSKAIGEWLITAANLHGHGVHFASVRGGNIWNSRGSVLEKWLSANPILVTDPLDTRFHLSMDYWLEFCLYAVERMHGGEVFIPKCDAWSLGGLASAFCEVYKDKTVKTIGPRSGDKTHETLISHYESTNATDLGWAYCVDPPKETSSVWNYPVHVGAKIEGEVSSDKARHMTVDELRTLITRTM